MLDFADIVLVSEEEINGHRLKIIEANTDEVIEITAKSIMVVPDHYVDPESVARTLERLGKPAAAEKLRIKLPQTKKIRSGDLGEILATEYIEECTNFSVPLKKLRWHDHRDMAMRGDDVIGFELSPDDQKLRFLKAEAKSRVGLGRGVMSEARAGLDLDDGKPAPHALAFVAERLNEIGELDLSDRIEKVLLKDGVNVNQIEHLLFTFTGSSPKNLQKETLEAYTGDIPQKAVGFRIREHQKFIADVFQGVIDGLDD